MTWKNLVFSRLMPAKENCASAWANHTAGRSGQREPASITLGFDISPSTEILNFLSEEKELIS
jgi:hypothetical protein